MSSVFFVAAEPVPAWEKRAFRTGSGGTLAESVGRFAEAQELGFFLDRRVDPGQPLRMDTFQGTNRDFFVRLAAVQELGFCELGEIAYLGPKDAAQKLSLLHVLQRNRIARGPGPLGSRLMQPVALKTEKLDTPKEIITQLADRLDIRITNADRIPHDLWPQRELPPIPACDLLSLLLIGFDATYAISANGTELTLVPIPPDLLRTEGAAARKQKPANVSKRSSPPDSVPFSRRRFTVEVKNQNADAVLRSFADSLNLTLEIDADSLAKKGISLDRPVSFQLKDATFGELFRAVLKPLGCKFTLRGKKLVISAE